MAELPPLHGLRLGTSRESFNSIFSPDNTVKFTPVSAARPELEGLEAIWTGFYQNHLSAIEFDYVRTPEWSSTPRFARYIESRLGLPFDAWVFIGETEAEMTCADFTAALSSVRDTLSLTDTTAKEAARRDARGRKLSQPGRASLP